MVVQIGPNENSFGMSLNLRCLFNRSLDLEFCGPSFTWQRGGTFVRLDRALVNDAWMVSFPQYLVSHLPRIKFDHRPLLLVTRPDLNLAKDRPFRFLVGWTKHNNFHAFVKEKWNFVGNMADSLNTFTSYVKEWNKDRHLIRSLNNIQKAQDHSDSSCLAKQEMKVRDELENVFNHEVLLWRQKARCGWLHLGDRNTKFFIVVRL
ncbi:Retrovirus-related Pol polyprotein LINE-1 [Gossypium australe]|uniref:Retrovirus-related Pol polyprotein LINE-1 n=1 Tax=Gossypium australe TaxID=47621 RepID=A0A5B6UWS7_9ROSI|nr:Retrovirus-related Pol polyprotein LINE-1 [Gossypium australe]